MSYTRKAHFQHLLHQYQHLNNEPLVPYEIIEVLSQQAQEGQLDVYDANEVTPVLTNIET